MFRSVLVFGLVWAVMWFGLERIAEQTLPRRSAAQTAEAFARGCILLEPEVFFLISLSEGRGLRKDLEKAYRNRTREHLQARPDFSQLTSSCMEENDLRAEYLVFGKVGRVFGNGSSEYVNGGMVVRLVRENTVWRVR